MIRANKFKSFCVSLRTLLCGGAIIGSRAVLKTAEGKPFQSSSLCLHATTARIHPRRSSLLDGGFCVRGSMRSHRSSPCDRSLMVEPQSSKLMVRVRFPSVAPKKMNRGKNMGENLKRKVTGVKRGERIFVSAITVLLLAAFVFFILFMTILDTCGMWALSAFLAAIILFVFYAGVYMSYQIFIEETVRWADKDYYYDREVVSLSYKRFSAFYTLSPEKWELSDSLCIYRPTSGQSFAIVFSFLDYLRYTHHELKQQLKTVQELKSGKNKEYDIKAPEQFAEYIKKDLASFEQEDPLSVLAEKCRKEDSHV